MVVIARKKAYTQQRHELMLKRILKILIGVCVLLLVLGSSVYFYGEYRRISTTPEQFKVAQARFFALYDVRAESCYVTLHQPNLRTHFLKIGKGEPLVLLHGGGNFASYFGPLLGSLQQHFLLLVPDRPGCGLSDRFDYRGVDIREHAVDFVKSFLDSQQIKKASFVGHSMGGYWSIAFALAHPNRVDKLILIGTPAGLTDSLPFVFHLFGTRGVNAWVFAAVTAFTDPEKDTPYPYFFFARPERVPPEASHLWKVAVSLPGTRDSFLSLMEQWVASHHKSIIRPELSHLKTPTLFIWGDKEVCPPAFGEEISKTMPNAGFEVVPDAGHHPWYEEPERCAELIIDFLK